jgi:hypothetical protein
MDVSRASYNPALLELRNPLLRYQLDPGEPGMLRSAHASQSVAAVSAQERGNLQQFKREAALAGRMVIHESITFTRGIEGLFTTIRAGLTEVVSVPAPSHSISPLPAGEESETDVEIEPAANPLEEDVEEIIEEKEFELLNRLSALRNHIELAKAEMGKAGNEGIAEAGDIPAPEIPDIEISEPGTDEAALVYAAAENMESTVGSAAADIDDKPMAEQVKLESPAKDRILRHEEEIREINRKLNELEIMRIQTGLAHLNEVLMGSIRKNLDLVADLIAVVNHIGPNSEFNDLSGEMPLLGMVLDFSV